MKRVKKQQKIKVTSDSDSARLDQYLSEHVDHLSRAVSKKLIEEGSVTIDGNRVKPSVRVHGGDLIQIIFPEPSQKATKKDEEVTPSGNPLSIIYEDNDLLAINKEAGVVVHPGVGTGQNTLYNELLKRDRTLARVGERAGIIHRLDKDTSGILLVAKNKRALAYYSSLFENRLIKKEYRAVALGDYLSLKSIGSTIDGFLRRSATRKTFTLFKNPPGRYSETRFNLLKEFRKDDKIYSYLKVFPKTGRTHQIRVHLKSVGRPIVGDILYKGEKNQFLLLHAYSLQFQSFSNEKLKLVAPTPKYFKEFISNGLTPKKIL